MTTYIYALIDPRTEQPHYVGKSKDPHARFDGHLRDAQRQVWHSPVLQWIRALLAEGVSPELVLLEDAGDDWAEAEVRWIERLKGMGYKLTNSKKGSRKSWNENSR